MKESIYDIKLQTTIKIKSWKDLTKRPRQIIVLSDFILFGIINNDNKFILWLEHCFGFIRMEIRQSFQTWMN